MENILEEIETLTEEEVLEKEEAERLERKEKFNSVSRFLQSEECENYCKYFEDKGNDLELEIRNELKTRVKAEAIYSELDRINGFTIFASELLGKLGDSEGEIILKQKLQEQIDNGNSIVMNKVEELFDVPVYTKLDFLKQNRIDYLLVRKRFIGYGNDFIDSKEDKPSLHPYED